MSKTMDELNKHVEDMYKNGWVEFNYETLLKLTASGWDLYKEILGNCINLINDSSPKDKEILNAAITELEGITGKRYTPVELYQAIFLVMHGSHEKGLAFLLHERQNNYKYLKSVLSEQNGSFGNEIRKLTLVKPQKYDA